MAQWIEVRARYDKMMENGSVKKVTEPYLVDALYCTEAEARVTEELTPFISGGDFRITSVVTTKISKSFGMHPATASTRSRSISSPLTKRPLPKSGRQTTSSCRLPVSRRHTTISLTA